MRFSPILLPVSVCTCPHSTWQAETIFLSEWTSQLINKRGDCWLYPNQHVTVTFGSGKALRVLLLCTEKNMLIFMSTKQRQSIILCGFQNPELQDMNDSECFYPYDYVCNNVLLCPNHPQFWWGLTLWLFCLEFCSCLETQSSVDHIKLSRICSYHYHRYIWRSSLAGPDLRSHSGKWLLQGQEDDCRPPARPPGLLHRGSRLSITMSWLCSSPFRHHQQLVLIFI